LNGCRAILGRAARRNCCGRGFGGTVIIVVVSITIIIIMNVVTESAPASPP
jgi:hypothetical protein